MKNYTPRLTLWALSVAITFPFAAQTTWNVGETILNEYNLVSCCEIPKDKYEDVFKPFFTLDPSRNKLKGESGLGLTIARDIVRSHGGEIKLSKSDLGGLKLLILLPI